ncbi:conserved hypothetical protein [Ricinus communis]|uniref:Uncharacterized protein n=1 Tax=Ricinus communis TaxID=3988 RepID=B9SAA3_RICCO|nr:conserved hypothetical protein [Ricinus communis]
MAEKNFKARPFCLGKDTFNYTPVALGVGLGLIMLWWVLDARKWFKGPVRNIEIPNGKV